MPSLWYSRSKPDQVKPVPWLSSEATAYLETILSPSFRVLEHGGGGSTLWLAERVASVLTVERDHDWALRLKHENKPNVKIISDTEAQDYPFDHYDLVLIDGEPVTERGEWLEWARLVLCPRWIVLDNANRPEYASERAELINSAKSVKTIDGNMGGTVYLVTEFYECE